MNIEGVPEILKSVLEDEDDDLVKEVGHPDPDSEGWWEQIGGDANAWEYGGTWWNPVKHRLVHFDGVEEREEIKPEQVQMPDAAMAKLRKRLHAEIHDPWLDTDEAKEEAKQDPQWVEKLLRDEERQMEWKTDEIVGSYQYARAAFLNNRKPRSFYDFDVGDGDLLPPWMERYVEPVKQSLGEYGEDFDSWPLHTKIAEILDQNGIWQEAGGFDMNKLEAQNFFGFKL